MKKATIFQQGVFAGTLEELAGGRWRFRYEAGYVGQPVSLTMPIALTTYDFDHFPPVFEGLLPEGELLEAMLRLYKIDRKDLFRQLVVTGRDLVGSLTVEEIVRNAASSPTNASRVREITQNEG